MWSNEQLKDAIGVLLSGSEHGDIQKVEDTVKNKNEKETYLVVGDVTYTDPLYIKALESLVKDGKFSKVKSEDGRETYKAQAK
jgi:hypothetical protein